MIQTPYERYQRERDKRIRADGNDQYREVQGELRAFVEDPYVEPGFVREPVREELEIVIIGGGFDGLVARARLHAAGFTDVRIIENGGCSTTPTISTSIGTLNREGRNIWPLAIGFTSAWASSWREWKPAPR